MRAVEALVRRRRQARPRPAHYARRWRESSPKIPADDEAQTFYALGLLATLPRGDASLPLRQQAGAIAEGVFARNPKHPGAAHYILHAYDHGTLAAEGAAGGAGLREDCAGGEPRAAHARARVPATGLLGRGGRQRSSVVGRVGAVGGTARRVECDPRLPQPHVAALRVDAAGRFKEAQGGAGARGRGAADPAKPADQIGGHQLHATAPSAEASARRPCATIAARCGRATSSKRALVRDEGADARSTASTSCSRSA